MKGSFTQRTQGVDARGEGDYTFVSASTFDFALFSLKCPAEKFVALRIIYRKLQAEELGEL